MHRIELRQRLAGVAILGAATLLGACAGPAPPARLAGTAADLDARVAQRCAVKAMPRLGADVATLHDFRIEDRARASRLFGIDRTLQIVAIEAGSPADAAGLRPGDRVEAVNGTPVPPGPQARRTYLTAAVDGHGHTDGGPVLSVRRDGQVQTVVLQSRAPCTVSVENPQTLPSS